MTAQPAAARGPLVNSRPVNRNVRRMNHAGGRGSEGGEEGEDGASAQQVAPAHLGGFGVHGTLPPGDR